MAFLPYCPADSAWVQLLPNNFSQQHYLFLVLNNVIYTPCPFRSKHVKKLFTTFLSLSTVASFVNLNPAHIKVNYPFLKSLRWTTEAEFCFLQGY